MNSEMNLNFESSKSEWVSYNVWYLKLLHGLVDGTIFDFEFSCSQVRVGKIAVKYVPCSPLNELEFEEFISISPLEFEELKTC